ncbi:glutamyl-tRNA synthetase [Delitschia confertaspora ATCC 74209]|uniref:Glutamate--tRNA ligase, mitochondrial n=1 Tax=Delitschia confertaspora ATCC 74209 TaxID=1513339 RepID=A0A9P4JPM9_9PLEO|nr:glutamyl-tRNA synthetase [Delitschia confertaspora ATCC 74209]
MPFLPLLRRELAPYTCKSCLHRLSVAARRHNSSFTASSEFRNTFAPKKNLLPKGPARTRFAPSPTGFLHLGSLRTALFNYLLAKKTGGQFILRIEDTDQIRTIIHAETAIFRDLQWAGLQWDEGPEVGGPYGPYRQSERTALYREHANKLLDSGHAYRCFCSVQRLKELAEARHKLGLPTDYDRTCANIPKEESDDRAHKGESHVVRLRVPDVYPEYEDLVYTTFKPLHQGRRAADAFEDPILLKSDSHPTYHLANVVDDHHMKITHVIRGSEWMPSTPKHVALYQAFGWTPPEFAHVGLLVDEQGNKLSKRSGDIGIRSFREQEALPEALVNFAALLGWSHQDKSDVMDLQELVQKFNLNFTRGNTIVTFGKLRFLQRSHAAKRIEESGDAMKEIVDNMVVALEDKYSADLAEILGKQDISLRDYVTKILKLAPTRFYNSEHFISQMSYLFRRPPVSPLTQTSEGITGSIAAAAKHRFSEVPWYGWKRANLDKKFGEIMLALNPEVSVDTPDAPQSTERKNVKRKEVWHYLRAVLTGEEQGLGVYDVMTLLGREECLRRLGVEQGRGK